MTSGRPSLSIAASEIYPAESGRKENPIITDHWIIIKMKRILNALKWKCKSFTIGLRRIISDFWLNSLAGSYLCPRSLRAVLYRITGNEIGRKAQLSPHLFLGPGKGKLHVGGGTFINYNCFFDLGDDIFIGECCNIAMDVKFINGSHLIGNRDRRAGEGTTGKIVVGPGTWIGADTLILPGVTIGKGVIVGAGSLVTSDLADNAVYIGRPAKIHKLLE